MNFIRKHVYTLAGVLLGAIGGYAYWAFIGCVDGYCPITSQALNATLYGALIGGLFLNSVNYIRS
jgi:uncharacterized membrane protein AbrB (regulator of aidB expression)